MMDDKKGDKHIGTADEFSVVTPEEAKKKKVARQKELADWVKQNAKDKGK